MKTTRSNSEGGAEQVTTQHEVIYLGVDLHKKTITVTRIIDHATPQPAQRFNWEGFWKFVEKQTRLAKKVYANYEAGAFGFWPHRQLKQMGVECFVVHPEKLDPGHKRTQTDKLDSRHLADRLQRYVLGNRQAMTVVYVPSEVEERQRIESRHRESLRARQHSIRCRGAGLLLSQGIFDISSWWTDRRWNELKGQLPTQLMAALEDERAMLQDLHQRLQAVERKLKDSAPKELPRGFGALSFVLLQREICKYERFKSRRSVGGFTGLGGAVSSSGPYHVDLSITKAGSAYLRTLLVELAWRMTYWQPGYRGLKVWRRIKRSTSKVPNKRMRKIAIVAAARQLMVDIWKWQTGRLKPEDLGWTMATAE